MRKLILVLTVAILSIGSVRGYLAARERTDRYPCAFEKKSGNTWRGGLSLDDAQRIRRESVRTGHPIPVRLREITASRVKGTIACVARAYGMAPAPFLDVGWCESKLTPKPNLYQYIGPTWDWASKTYGHKGAPRSSTYSQIHTTVQVVRDQGWEQWTCKP